MTEPPVAKNDLLDRLRKSKSHAEKLVQASTEGPLLKRSVDQLDDASRSLLSRVSSKSINVEAEATRFLGMHGYNCNKLQRLRNAISLKQGFEPLDRLAEADVDGYLKHQRKLILLTAIEEAKAGTTDSFLNGFARALERDWRSARAELEAGLGTNEGDWSVHDDVTMSDNVAAVAVVGGGVGLTSREGIMVQCVGEEAEKRRRGHHGVEDVHKRLGDVLCNAGEGQDGGEEQRQLWRVARGQMSANNDKERVIAAVRTLEQQMGQLVRSAAGGGGVLVGGGGQPGWTALCRQYAVARGWHQDGGWGVLWLLLRVGAVQEAIQFAAREMREPRLEAAIKGDPTATQAPPPPSAAQQQGRPDFRAAVWCSVGAGTEAQARETRVFSTTEDYVWLRLKWTLRDGPGQGKNSVSPHILHLQQALARAQDSFRDRPALLCQLRMLAQDYDGALSPLLADVSHPLHCDAIHLAIVLQLPQRLDYVARWVRRTVLPWSSNAALDYGLIEGSAVCVALLLAAPRLAEQLSRALPDATERSRVLEQVAQLCQRAGRHDEAAQLYERASLWEQAMQVHCGQVARAVQAREGRDSSSLRRAREAVARCQRDGGWQRVDVGTGRALSTLLEVSEQYSLQQEGSLHAALEHWLQRLSQVAPPSQRHMQACVESSETAHPAVAAVLPELLVALMSLLQRLYQHVKAQPTRQQQMGDGGRAEQMRSLKQQAQLLVSFAGMVQQRLSGDVFARLIALSSSMT